MASSTQLNATEQDTVVKQIGLSLLRAAPRDWRRITAQYRAVGRYHELTGEIVLADGETQEWVATHDIATLFGRLRTGMYREGRGTWFNARYQLDHPSSYNLEYDREEPDWELPPPPQAYADELRMFPRSEENVPDWLMHRMSGLTPEHSGPRFRMARIFDGTDSDGYPIIDRPGISTEEQERLLDFLNGAPVVIPGRGYDIDPLASTPENRVPIAFHSDGTWIWPAAVNYYLHEYGIAPEPDLIQHIHTRGFAIPDVPHATREAAAAHISQGGPPPQPPAPPAGTAPPHPSPGEKPETAEQPPPDERFAEHPAERTQLAQPPLPDETDIQQDRYDEAPPVEEPPNDIGDRLGPTPADGHEPPTTFSSPPHPGADPPTTTTPAASPAPHSAPDSFGADTASPSAPNQAEGWTTDEQSPPLGVDEPVVHDLNAILMDLGVPESTYRIGEPVEYGWALEEVPEGWRVGWYNNRALTGPAVFGDVQDAAAFMLGKLLLTPVISDQERQAPAPPPQQGSGPEEQTVSPPSAAADTQLSLDPVSDAPPTEHAPEPATAVSGQADDDSPSDRRRQENVATESGGKQQWPIQPLPGEPPLTLFRGKELQELPAGSELDRFGDPDGNLLYAAGTPFEERSLVPEWVNRPYHVYRLQRPLETLAGVAIPWFNQPGGGAAYVLPTSITELVSTGDLIELDAEEPPID